MKTCVIFNPAARGEKARELRGQLESATDCLLQPTTCEGDARILAAQCARYGFETIIAAGGDGTINEVVNGIADAPEGLKRVRLGILPLGTVNVFARELGVPRNLRGAWKMIRSGKESIIDLGRAEFLLSGQRRQRYFIQLAGAGLDSRAVALVSWDLKKKTGPLAYVIAGLQAVREAHPIITVAHNGQGTHGMSQPVSGEQILLGNGRFYGGSFKLFPKATLQDAMLDICVFPKVNWAQIARAGLGLVTGQLHRLCGVTQIQSSSVTLSSPSPVLLELDGENVGELPATITVVPESASGYIALTPILNDFPRIPSASRRRNPRFRVGFHHEFAY